MQLNHGLVVDPPRKGLHKDVVTIIKNKKPKKIAYLSCNPATLARDLKLLCKDNIYSISKIQPIDFFPQTTHVECLALLERVST